MKNIKNLILVVATIFSLYSCDSLDIKNLESYDANSVWSDANLASAYITNLYANVFPNWPGGDTDSEMRSGMPFYEGTITETGGSYKVWNYTKIRLVNEAIQELENGSLLESKKNQLLGECYFMRAYLYSDMIFYHGGVPYIKTPQDKDKDDLFVKRNSTKECFQYIIEDIDYAISLLPEKQSGSSTEYGRIDQCFAKAYKAKVLLYKASPQFNPSNPYDNIYWKEAYNAAKEAYDFCINNGASLTPDYADIWLKEKGSEVIFAVINSNPNKTEGWESSIRPGSVSRGPAWGTPTWNFIKEIPMLDGRSYNDKASKYYVGDNETDLLQVYWKNRDPRFDKSILYNGKPYPVAGKSNGYRQYTALGLADEDDCYGINAAAGQNAANNDSYTGFFIFKGSDLSLVQDKVLAADVDYILMRLPELMLIYSEAANETGHSDVAVNMLKQIRQRAGLESGVDGMYGLNVGSREKIREAILNERNIELCFEGHRFMDLRRTRNMMKLDKLYKYGVEAIAINPDGSDMNMDVARKKVISNDLLPEDFRYVLHTVPLTPSAEKQFVIKETYYFFPIQKVKILENENIEQNNNWGGTFNPTME